MMQKRPLSCAKGGVMGIVGTVILCFVCFAAGALAMLFALALAQSSKNRDRMFEDRD